MKLAFVDTETTGTDPWRHEVWEVAVVVEDERGIVLHDFSAMVRPEDLASADSGALQVGRFYQRFPHPDNDAAVTPRSEVAQHIAVITADTMLVGCNVAYFDAQFLRELLRAEGFCPAWHYNPLDVKALAVGVLGLELPRTTDQLLDALGIDAEVLGADRHTARGDVEVARALYHMAVIDRERVVLQQLRQRGWQLKEPEMLIDPEPQSGES